MLPMPWQRSNSSSSMSKPCLPGELLAALQANFEGYESMRRKLDEDGPKVGSNDDRADALLVRLFEDFASACEEYGRTPRGGILRPGTGSAMYYIWLASGHAGMREPVVAATADGRLEGQPFSANLAPSPGVRVRGPISTLQSFSRIDYRRVCNGGPITMELSDSVFRDAEFDPQSRHAGAHLCPARLPAIAAQQPECGRPYWTPKPIPSGIRT